MKIRISSDCTAHTALVDRKKVYTGVFYILLKTVYNYM